eukprot:Anaeramoba_ignava/a218200_74.p5 GENE.a218200_74~~a218200_74.p5  ORF type:complete len:174 (-),score=24.98 a218200_74:2922-3443(-)
MPNPQNIKIVEETTAMFKEAQAIYFTDYKGLSVKVMNDLRGEFFKNNVEYKVIKKTLTKISGENAGYENFDNLMDGQMAVAFANDDPVMPARILKKFIKDNKLTNLKLTGCLFEGVPFDATKVDSIAELPTRDELIAKLARTLNAPMTNVVNVMQASMRKVVNVLNALKDKKE